MKDEKKGRTLCVGDIHGNYLALKQVLERCNFDNEKDTLISLGDVVDGHSQSFEVVEELLKIKNLIAIKGNHDDWFWQWIVTGINPANWGQGQKATGLSYLEHDSPGKEWYEYIDTPGGGKEFRVSLRPIHLPVAHKDFFKNQLPYHLDHQDRLFVHGGFNRHYPLEEQGDILWWDRDLWHAALLYEGMTKGMLEEKPKFKMVGDYSEVYIGHTSIQFWEENAPMKAANITNLDTGAGWYGKLTIYDVDTKEFWQSDPAKELYPDFHGR
jgi:serine/threonine protein phosphatase 1